MMEVKATEYLAASVRLMTAVEGLDDEIRRPLERLAKAYGERAWKLLAPVQDVGSVLPPGERV